MSADKRVHAMTSLRFRYLRAIMEICLKQLFATPTEVEAVMGLKPRMAKQMMKRLLDMGLLERPYRGCYRLADEGRKILKEASRSELVEEAKEN